MTADKTYSEAVSAILARCEEVGDCMVWTGSDNGSGHPKIRVAGKSFSARRAMWRLLHTRAIPSRMMVTTTCRDKACLCPEHLTLATKSSVSLAAATSTALFRRAVASARTNRATQGKITMEIAREIRCSNKSGRDYAKELGVSPSHISKIRTNQSWVEFSSPFAGLMR
jgi:hypothetical protein